MLQLCMVNHVQYHLNELLLGLHIEAHRRKTGEMKSSIVAKTTLPMKQASTFAALKYPGASHAIELRSEGSDIRS